MSAQAADNIRKLSESGKDQFGRFASGPGNVGRPKGAVSRVNRELLAQVKLMGPRAIAKLSEAVDKSEKWAVKYVLNRILPEGRSIELHGTTPDDISEALKSGDISTAEAKELSATIAKLKEVAELDDHREQLAKILSHLQAPG